MTSYLFTPVHQDRLVARAHDRGADVVLLDLEDSVPPAEKPRARVVLPDAVAALAARGARVAVRVNGGLGDLARDIEAACLPGVEALMVPKVAGPESLQLVGDHLDRCRADAGLHRPIGLIALIETAGGLLQASRIARAPRLTALAFGTEDFSADCGHAPSPETLAQLAQQLIWTARAAGIAALGLPASIADVADIASFERHAALGQRLGFDGVLCIHPRQVEVVNRLYTPSPDAVAAAQRIVVAHEAAERAGQGAVLVNGRMVDPPVVARALRLLRRKPARKDPA